MRCCARPASSRASTVHRVESQAAVPLDISLEHGGSPPASRPAAAAAADSSADPDKAKRMQQDAVIVSATLHWWLLCTCHSTRDERRPPVFLPHWLVADNGFCA